MSKLICVNYFYIFFYKNNILKFQSQPHLSRVRSCCRGYIRNIHNFYKCDPVCTQECVNALCTAPDTCTCFPDHIKNRAGFCIPTCPIGCQNGQCSGGECLCKQGYTLDSQSGQFCVPTCQENCGGIGKQLSVRYSLFTNIYNVQI